MAETRKLAATTLLALILAACGSTAPSAPTPASKPAPAPAAATPTVQTLQPLSFAFDFVPNGDQVGFWTAYANGYYRAHGLDVHFIQGSNANTTSDAVATGKVDMGLIAAGAVAQFISQGAPLRMVAAMVQTNPFGLVFRADHPLKNPRDVYGKKIGVPPGTDADLYWRVFVAANHLDISRLHVVSTSPASQMGLLAKGQLDAYSGAIYTAVPAMTRMGVQVGTLLYSKDGVGGMGDGVVASDRMLKSRPDAVRGFLAATAQGFAAGASDPTMAGRSILAAASGLNQGEMADGFRLALGFLHSPATTGRPWGWQAASDWQGQLDVLTRFEGMKHPLPVDRYFTNAYLQQSAS